MTAACKECGAHTEWDDDAGSAICTSCGTLADPSQTILADSSCYNLPSDSWHPTILKSFRTQGHSLAGQSQETRDARNHYAMSQFVNSLATSINASGLSPRATLIFTQAMTAGKFRWGRKAKLVAGASLALALRENHRPDSLHDIAYLLNVQCPTLVRALASIISLLDLSLAPADPVIHIPRLLAHFTRLLALDPGLTVQLPGPLITQIKGVSLRAASNTATSLCTLLARLGPDHSLNSLPSPPTAIAIFLISIEAELRSPLSQLGELVQALGASCHKTSRSVVMARYKLVQDEISTWIEQIPWLGKYKQLAANGKNRAKTGKRLVVARGVADVIQFQDEIWRGKLRPTVELDVEDEEDDNDEDSIHKTEASVSDSTPSNQPTLPLSFSASRPAKRQKTSHHPLRDATQFLLNPLVGPLPDCESPPQPLPHPHTWVQQLEIPQSQNTPVFPPPLQNNTHHARSAPQPPRLPVSYHLVPPPPSDPTLKPPGSSLPSYILAAPSISILHSRAPPTRLQLLAASRGGADAIEDEELFGEGELDGLIRPQKEAEEVWRQLVVLGILGEDDDEEDGSNGSTMGGRGKKGDTEGKRRGGGEEGQSKKSRVDLDALARFLEDKEEDYTGADDTALLGLEMFSDKNEDEDGDGDLSDVDTAEDGDQVYWDTMAVGAVMKRGDAPRTPSRASGRAGPEETEVVVDEWRPMSPGVGSGNMYGGGYEEEYD